VKEEELKIRKRHQMMYEINKKYFKKGEHSEYERFNEKNIKILKEYEKNERT